MAQSDQSSEARQTGLALRIEFPKAWLEICIVVILLLLGVSYVLDAVALPTPRNPSDVGPGAFPLLVGGGTIAVLLVLLFRTILGLARDGAGETVVVTRAGWVALSMLVLLGTALLFETLGLLPVTLICTALLLLFAGLWRPLPVALIAAGLAAGIYVLFVTILGVRFY